MRTNKLGDLLLELRDPNTSDARLEEIARFYNELGEREEKYKSLLTTSGIKLESPQISKPLFLTSPLDVYTFNALADTSIANDTPVYLSFDDYAYTQSSAFQVDVSDKTKVRTTYPGQSFAILGNIEWTSNGTGYRHASFEAFNNSGTSLGSVQLHTVQPDSGVETAYPVAFVINFRQIKDMAYFKIFVRQKSGGPLVLKEALFSAFLV